MREAFGEVIGCFGFMAVVGLVTAVAAWIERRR